MKRKWNKMYQNGQKELTYWQFPDKHIAGISSSSDRLYKRQPRPRRWLTQLPSGRDLAHTDQLQYADATIHMGAARTLPAPHSPPPEGFVLLPHSLPMKTPECTEMPRRALDKSPPCSGDAGTQRSFLSHQHLPCKFGFRGGRQSSSYMTSRSHTAYITECRFCIYYEILHWT